MSILNKAITSTLHHMPKWFAKPFAKPYVAGESIDEVLKQVKLLNSKGFCATIDILGEYTLKKEEAKKVTSDYCKLYDKIFENKLDCNISLKLTHIGLSISYEQTIDNISKILSFAKKYKNFLRIDMESSNFTEQTIEIYKYCKARYHNVGIVIQSYLIRSENDIRLLANKDFNCRICKGIYNEPASLAFKDYEKIKTNFLTLAKIMAEKSAYSCIATHDQDLIDKLLNWICKNNISKNQFEFQSLYGVPMQGKLESLIEKGFKVRIYVPFGSDWFDYSIRRLKENPSIAKYVVKNFLRSKK